MTARPLNRRHTNSYYAAVVKPTPGRGNDEDDDDDGDWHDETVDHVEQEDNEDDYASDGQSIIGVSIGRAQTQLQSPTATTNEKIAALNHAGSSHDKVGHRDFAVHTSNAVREQQHADTLRERRPEASNLPPLEAPHTPVRRSTLPSPWVAGPKTNWTIDGLEEEDGHPAFAQWRRRSRPRASTLDDESGWKKFIPSFPALHRLSIASFSSSTRGSLHSTQASQDDMKDRMNNAEKESSSKRPLGEKRDRSHSEEPEDLSQVNSDRSFTPKYQSIISPKSSSTTGSQRPQALRRSTSDTSLLLQRSLSRASSLGDDSRWTNVHEQVNSRGKAIRDSFADSNMKFRLPDISNMPSMPSLPSISSINLNNPWRDGRSTSPKKRSNSLLPFKGVRSESPQRNAKEGHASSTANHHPVPEIPAMSPEPGMSKTNAQTHPHFTKALKNVTGDLVILGGYRGSVLRSAEPPNRQCWVPIKVGLNLRKVNLEVGLEADADERMEETIIPSGMLKNIGPVDISRRLFKRLSASNNAANGTLRVWDFGYDWRLNPNFLSERLIEFLEGLACNAPDTPEAERGATVIAHSLGGLITRHAINKRPELVKGVIYAGVPQTCVNILGPLRNGDDVLLSSKVLTAQVNFTIRSSFALLPLDGKCFFNRETKEPYNVDFFNPKTWEEYCLSPVIARPLPAPGAAPPSGITGLVGTVSNMLPSFSLPHHERSASEKKARHGGSGVTTDGTGGGAGQRAIGPQMGNRDPPAQTGENAETNVSTAVTLSREAAFAYLARILGDVKRFKEELAFRRDVDERGLYPSAAVIYGKSTPTVYGAQVRDRDAIRQADAYDDLAFASGDGVVLARASQIPEGYRVARGGVVSSDRGHISLLGDLEAVGRCLNAIHADRKKRRRGAGPRIEEHAEINEPLGEPCDAGTT